MRDMHLYGYFEQQQKVECNCGWNRKAKDSAEAFSLHASHKMMMEAEWQESLKTISKLPEPTSDPRLNESIGAVGCGHGKPYINAIGKCVAPLFENGEPKGQCGYPEHLNQA